MISPQLLQMILAGQGGQGGQQRPNAAPQIPVQTRPGSMAPIVQAPPSPGASAGGGGVGGAVNAGQNVEKLYNMGNNAYNWGANQLGYGQNASSAGQNTGNPMSMGAPAANTPAGNTYMQQNPWMAQGGGQTPTGFIGPGSAPTSGMAYNGGSASSPSGMFGPTAANGTPMASQSGMFGPAGATGGTGATGASAANGGAAATGTEAGASDSSPTWLQQIWDFL